MKEKNNIYCVTVDLGKVNYSIKAKSEEDAICLANEKAWLNKKRGSCGLTIPKVVQINGKDYIAPPAKVVLAGAAL